MGETERESGKEASVASSLDINENAAAQEAKAVPSTARCEGVRAVLHDGRPMEKHFSAVQNGDQDKSSVAEQPGSEPAAPTWKRNCLRRYGV